MASEAPDPKSFSSWQDAFAYPIPVVRGMEKQLRRDVDSNRDKLRTLVGASYRDLLGTADSIIKMDGQMQDVEGLLGEIGRRCDARIIERKERNYQRWRTDVEGKARAKKAWISQVHVLKACPDVIAGLLRGGHEGGLEKNVEAEKLLVAAKVLVLSRLLHTKLSKREDAPPYLDVLRNRLATLRRRLLVKIERRFKSLDASREGLVEGMCAFALATSSSAGDVVRHFQHQRIEAMGDRMEENDRGKTDAMLRALKLYVNTLRDTKGIVPSQLAISLQGLKAVPIFKSRELVTLMELNLDTNEPWIGDDIKGFTPYIRHDDLTRAEMERTATAWAKTAIKTFLDGLKAQISLVEETKDIMRCRQQLLELWLSQHRHGAGVDAVEVLDGMRYIFNDRMTVLIQRQAQLLQNVGALVGETMKNWRPGVSDDLTSLWSAKMTSIETSNGARVFRSTLGNLLAGKNETLLHVLSPYMDWLRGIQVTEEEIEVSKIIKWDENIDEMDDMDELLDDKQMLLSEDDPLQLQRALRENLFVAFAELEKLLSTSASDLQPEHRGHQAVFILRVIREIRMHQPASHRSAPLGENLVPKLFSNIAVAALGKPYETCSKRLDKHSHSTNFPARALWEGAPEIPVLPSPWAYRLLMQLTQSMAGFGADVWSSDAVKTLKAEALAQLIKLLERKPESPIPSTNGVVHGDHKPEAVINGDDQGDAKSGQDETESIEDDRESTNDATSTEQAQTNGKVVAAVDSRQTLEFLRERNTQKLFDVLYLSNALSVSDTSISKDMERVQKSLLEDISLDVKVTERMKKGAVEYWRRTSLLFGLLA